MHSEGSRVNPELTPPTAGVGVQSLHSHLRRVRNEFVWVAMKSWRHKGSHLFLNMNSHCQFISLEDSSSYKTFSLF